MKYGPFSKLPDRGTDFRHYSGFQIFGEFDFRVHGQTSRLWRLYLD